MSSCYVPKAIVAIFLTIHYGQLNILQYSVPLCGHSVRDRPIERPLNVYKYVDAVEN